MRFIPVPSAFITYSCCDPPRSELKTMRLASGAKLGDVSMAEFVVRRFALFAYQYKGLRQYLATKFAEDESLRDIYNRSGDRDARDFNQQLADEIKRLDELQPNVADMTYMPF